MAHPKTYDPQPGYKFQIFCRNQAYGKTYEHCDYARDAADKRYLLDNYRQAYGVGWEFKAVLLPAKYWPDWVMSRRVYRQSRQERHRIAVT